MSGFAYGDNDNQDQILIDGDISKTLTKYATDPNYETRQEFARTLSHILRQQPLEDILSHIHDFIAAILMVSEDKSPIVRTSLVEQIPYVFLQCHEHACPDLEHYLYDRLLQIVLNYLQDEECEVRRESFSALQLLLEKYVLDTKRIEEKVCPAIICPIHKINYESLGEFNINAITFMGRIAPIIGPQKTEELFLNHFINLCKSRINTIRRTCASIFPTISYVLGTTITETNLLETFILLCEDIFWGVRKACAESIAVISLICTLECRKNRIAPIVLKLAKDSNKWVVCATFKVLGQIISSFADPCITGLAYSYNGELHITNPVDTDFREISDPQTLANYEHYLYMFANGDINIEKLTSTANNEKDTSSINKNDEILSTRKIMDCENFIVSNNNDDDDNDIHNFNDETLSSEQIAQLIIESKKKLVKQINDAVCLKRSIFKNDVWNTWEFEDDNKNDSNNINCNKNNDNKLDKDELHNIFESTLGLFKNNETTNSTTSTTNTTTSSVVADTSNEFIASSASDSTVSDNNPIKSFKSDTWTNSNSTDNNNTFSTGDISNNINQNSNISETKGRRRSGLLVQAHSFWRKNTPTDLSSIIKKAINEQPQQQPYPQKKPIIFTQNRSNEKQHDEQQHQQLPLQTPSCNSSFSNITEEELSKIFESLQVSHSVISEFVDEVKDSTNKSNDNKIQNNNNNSGNSSSLSDENVSNLTSNIDTGFNSCGDPHDDNNDDEALNEFNSYKYWHIDPELPLDTKIVENHDWHDLIGLMSYKSNRINDIVKETSSSSASKFKPPTNFQQNIVPVGILESYVTMVLHEEEEIKLNCAYNFPAVVLTIGKSNWHILKSLLQFLCDDIDWKVRKTIATSIDLLATILGKNIATKDLVPIYLGFFKDLDEVKIEAIRNFANFLKAIDQSKHKEILSNIGVCLRVDSKTNWRIKEDLAKQICLLIKMYNSINNHDSLLYLTSLTGFFLEDKVSCVREIAADAMSEIIVISNEKQREAIVKYFLVDEFANSDSWRKRQTFLIIFYKLIKCENPLIDLLHLIFSSVKRLSYDAVPNIRLLVAKNLAHLINIYEKRKEPISDDILQIVRRLRQDDDRDVRELFDSVDHLKIEEDESNDIFNNDTLATTVSTVKDENNSSEEGGDNEDTEIKLKNYNNNNILHNPMEGESYSDILKASAPQTSASVVLSTTVPTNKNIELSKNVDGNEQIETNT